MARLPVPQPASQTVVPRRLLPSQPSTFSTVWAWPSLMSFCTCPAEALLSHHCQSAAAGTRALHLVHVLAVGVDAVPPLEACSASVRPGPVRLNSGLLQSRAPAFGVEVALHGRLLVAACLLRLFASPARAALSGASAEPQGSVPAATRLA